MLLLAPSNPKLVNSVVDNQCLDILDNYQFIITVFRKLRGQFTNFDFSVLGYVVKW